MDFKDKVVLVTGASAGIGEATAILFAEHGAKLSLVGRNESKLRAVAARCERAGAPPPLMVVADLGTDHGCERTARETLDRYGRMDVLVNNAGVGAKSCIQSADMQTFDEVFKVNVRGVYNLTRLLVPALLQTRGNIVNVSSVTATMPAVGSLPYAMAKAALDHFSRLVALELAPKGVRVNTVSPGVTVSEFEMRLSNCTEVEYQAWLGAAEKMIPMGRVCQPEHIAKTILHLASDSSELVTGVVIPIDGGINLAGVGNSSFTELVE